MRERITELDLVIESVIPSTPNSRAVERASIEVPMLVAEVDGREVTLTGVDNIIEFFDEKFLDRGHRAVYVI